MISAIVLAEMCLRMMGGPLDFNSFPNVRLQQVSYNLFRRSESGFRACKEGVRCDVASLPYSTSDATLSERGVPELLSGLYCDSFKVGASSRSLRRTILW